MFEKKKRVIKMNIIIFIVLNFMSIITRLFGEKSAINMKKKKINKNNKKTKKNENQNFMSEKFFQSWTL